MKAQIIKKISNLKKQTFNIEKDFNKLNDALIKMGFYNTKYSTLIRNLLFISNEMPELIKEILKIEENTCRLMKKW